jgi:tetratricopeptide (TPR) repeat protein
MKNSIFARPRLQALLLSVLLVAATVAVYAPVLNYPFIDFDDPLYVMENPKVRSGLSWDTLRWSFTGASESTNYWVPLTWISFLIDSEISGVDPGGYHRTNLLLHAANSLLLFLLLLRATGCLRRSWMVAMLFAVHPLHVESVAWIAERKDVLSTFFALLTLIAYRRYARRPSIPDYLPVLGLFILGIMAKPMLVTLPGILLLMDYWPLGRYPTEDSGRIAWRKVSSAAVRLLAEKIPLLAVSVAASVGAYLIQAEEGAVASTEAIPWSLRAAVAVSNYAGYLIKTVWPVDLSIVYLYPAAVPVATTVLSVGFLAVATFLFLRLGTTRPYLPVGWFWYLGTLLPVVGLVVIGPHAMADRYTYIPLIGIFLAAVWWLCDLAEGRPVLKRSLAPVAVAVLITLSVVAGRQVTYWQSTEALFARAAAVTEENWFALNALGRQYEKDGRLVEALEIYRQSYRIHPKIPETLFLLAEVQIKLGRNRAAEQRYREAIRLKPDFPAAHNNLANLLIGEGRRKEALFHYREAIRLHPGYARARYNLAVALEQEGRIKEAAGHYLEAIRVDPFLTEAYINLGVLMYRSGDKTGAEKMFRAALRVDPQSTGAKRNLKALLKSRK